MWDEFMNDTFDESNVWSSNDQQYIEEWVLGVTLKIKDKTVLTKLITVQRAISIYDKAEVLNLKDIWMYHCKKENIINNKIEISGSIKYLMIMGVDLETLMMISIDPKYFDPSFTPFPIHDCRGNQIGNINKLDLENDKWFGTVDTDKIQDQIITFSMTIK